ncbi:MAG: DNA-directed RNA polymerase subunit beta', partial [Schleiferiaceae bacterium]|nr:DNA-directed RNA polymerase subunit beta' [Schleiferiaceae bacterium]
DVYVEAGELISDDMSLTLDASPIETVEVRSPLTCETKRGICSKCYGRNLASAKMVQRGESVGVIAAQSIGEPGTQLTLRTFHVGGTAGNISEVSNISAKFEGKIELEDVRTVIGEDSEGKKSSIVIGRTGELRVIDAKSGVVVMSGNVPYGSTLLVKDGDKVKKAEILCTWDPYNAVIISEYGGSIGFADVVQGVTYKVEIDEQTGFQDKVIVDSRNKKLVPMVQILDKKGKEIKQYTLPVGAHIMVDDTETIKTGKILVKIPRKSSKAGDITGGLPRVTELLEARNPSNPAVVATTDGTVSYGKIKRGNREIIIESRTGDQRKYLIKLSKQILVQENDFVRAGTPLSEGAITPSDILAIKGPTAVQEYLVNEIQDVYRLQGVKINDKHFEVIVRQMMRKVNVVDAGDTKLLEGHLTHVQDFMLANDDIFDKKVVIEAGDSEELTAGQIIGARQLRDENSLLKRNDKALVEARDANPATAKLILQGITRASLQTKSWVSAASFQETTKVLNEASIAGKRDTLRG